MKKKTISILCSLVLLSALGGCRQEETANLETESDSTTESESGDTAADHAIEIPSPDAEADGSVQESADPAAIPSPTDQENPDAEDSAGDSLVFSVSADASAASPQTVLEWEGLSLSADYWDPETLTLHFSAENTSDSSLIIQAAYCAVNGSMQTPDFSLSADAASSVQGSMSFSNESLSDSGITQAGSICFTPVILNGLDYTTLYMGQPVTVETGLAKDNAIPQGQLLAEQDGIRISYIGSSDHSSWGTDFLLCIENHSGKTLSFETGDTLVNDLTVSPMFSVTVTDGNYAVSSLSLFSEELEAQQIHDIQSLKFSIRVLDPTDYHTIETLDNLAPAVS